MLYTLLYMASTRTQIYLTDEQRERLDELGAREGKSLAQLIREAVEAYLSHQHADFEEVMRATFGAAPKLEVPSRDEWDRDFGLD